MEERLNLDVGTLNLEGGTLSLDGETGPLCNLSNGYRLGAMGGILGPYPPKSLLIPPKTK